MKFVKLDDPIIDEIIVNKLDHVGLINDKDQISINDEVEFFNNANVVFGKAVITKVTIQNSTEFDSDKTDLDWHLNVMGEGKNDKDILKIIYFKFEPYKEPRKLATNIELDVSEIKIYADGGSRGNPGPSASGYALLTKDDQIIKQNGVYLGITTNNQAEYKALLFALKDAIELESKIVSVFMDSLLVINQMKQIYKIKNRDLIPIHAEITGLLKNFQRVTFTHVPRELNKLADSEVNKCLDLQKNS
jgi:ribonuclease HI